MTPPVAKAMSSNLLAVVLCVSRLDEWILNFYLAVFLVTKLVCPGAAVFEWRQVTTSL